MSHIDDASTLPVSWWKSTASGAVSDCVEFGIVDERVVAVRDSKNPTGPALLLSFGQVHGLVAAVRDGRFE
ncbi:DUF397 domain-containing protein [Streptomyces netropsis]|uniref:DUF397 domain-containing protein n=1 Tax=Streptomyces netropsis TaxID=55404 RepID=A0A7W7LBB0_STRNE|nr:DUF397 domain-containing protein [Streptomyces netropsis]MBB4887078.1 hypothetical protein [Streptomyces netropsis]GGR25255.1 hypothetical protein GCM10010219_32760 [Streptomyces netropsis]